MRLPTPSPATSLSGLGALVGLVALALGGLRWGEQVAPVQPEPFAAPGIVQTTSGLAPEPALDPWALGELQPLLARWWAAHPAGLGPDQLMAFTVTGALPEALALYLDATISGPVEPVAFLAVPPALAAIQARCPAVPPLLAPLCQADQAATWSRHLDRALLVALDSEDQTLATQAALVACARTRAGLVALSTGSPSTTQGRALALFVAGCGGSRQAEIALAAGPPLRWMALLECSRLDLDGCAPGEIAVEQRATVAGALARYGLSLSTASSSTPEPPSP